MRDLTSILFLGWGDLIVLSLGPAFHLSSIIVLIACEQCWSCPSMFTTNAISFSYKANLCVKPEGSGFWLRMLQVILNMAIYGFTTTIGLAHSIWWFFRGISRPYLHQLSASSGRPITALTGFHRAYIEVATQRSLYTNWKSFIQFMVGHSMSLQDAC